LQDGATRLDRLEAALAMLATETAAEAHPAVRRSAVRPPAPPAPPPAHDAAWLGALFGSDYYAALLALFAAARTSIDVCMFHIAVPDAGHPTFRLLDALRSAHARGVAVRVLMDQDRASDPYRSTIINSPAKALLDAAGIACRLDHTDRLLHSKFVLIDGTLVILGSHNWTAGSYFQFDDLSVAVSSPLLAQELGTRFATLWELSAP
jgi:phosphatidylserine/phosphatidylglycerophosphate/cardiolipin synthase-like enzyme